MTLPEWVSSEERKPAPMPLLLVQSFLNTRDIETGTDLLLEEDSARAWLTQTQLIRTGARLTDAELRTARGVRDGLRALITRHSEGGAPTAAELRPLRALADNRQPRLSVDGDGRVELSAARPADLLDGLIGVLLTVRDAQDDGTWSRLKVCANPECRWVFFDSSRNRQGTWCAMAVCGNRLKNRRFRARRRG